MIHKICLKVDSWHHKVNKEIKELSRTGSWCAYRESWSSDSAVITYDKIFHVDSNMDKNALNTGAGET